MKCRELQQRLMRLTEHEDGLSGRQKTLYRWHALRGSVHEVCYRRC